MPLVGLKKKLKLLVIPVLSSILAFMIFFTNSFWKLNVVFHVVVRSTEAFLGSLVVAAPDICSPSVHTSCQESRNSSSASHRGRFYRPMQISTRQFIIYDTIRIALRLRTTFTQTSTLLACQGRDIEKKKNVMFIAKIRTLKKSLTGLSICFACSDQKLLFILRKLYFCLLSVHLLPCKNLYICILTYSAPIMYKCVITRVSW